ncbi:hypothetical protein SLEP1_g14380 [Rubroshorea leprosula]|uniref:Ribosomal protein L2 n=1 Tax=Rubroshorea leprosula TaxID=152421 RepID=A0AAV5ITF1_9ROSI|nr:hypothetical protein SLEP1_g14380 [Rubroshorea leprosula]
MDNLSLKRLSHTRIYKQGTGASRLGKAGGICRGKLTELPKIGGTRAIKPAEGQSKVGQIRIFQQGGKDLWVLGVF